MISITTLLGRQKAKTRKDLVEQLMSETEMFISIVPGEHFPKLIYIEIHGKLAQIPSLKNSRPKFGGMDKRTFAAIKALDKLFIASAQEQNITQKQLSFGDEMIHIGVVCGGRATANEDNAMTTIKDWLEAPTKLVGGKRKRIRGWGIGIIKDDIQARGYALKASDLYLDQNRTSIAIRPWSEVREDATNFIAKCRMPSCFQD